MKEDDIKRIIEETLDVLKSSEKLVPQDSPEGPVKEEIAENLKESVEPVNDKEKVEKPLDGEEAVDKDRVESPAVINRADFRAKAGNKVLLTENRVRAFGKDGTISIEGDYLITPSAQDLVDELGIKIISINIDNIDKSSDKMTNIVKSVALGSDHRGFELKKQLKQFLIMKGFEVADLGTDSPETCDYPDFAYLVAHAVVSDKAQRGIMIDSRGLASAMVANKVKGSRAAVCNDISSALSSRAHNDSNILALGAEVITTEQAKGILEVWLKTPFEGGRYQKRLDKISKIEQST